MSSCVRTGFEHAVSEMKAAASQGREFDIWFGAAMALMNWAGAAKRWEFEGAKNEARFLRRRAQERARGLQ